VVPRAGSSFGLDDAGPVIDLLAVPDLGSGILLAFGLPVLIQAALVNRRRGVALNTTR
jgi:hypothetical protein